MELERDHFMRVIASHSIKMQRVVDVFIRNREEHKQTFRFRAQGLVQTTPLTNPYAQHYSKESFWFRA